MPPFRLSWAFTLVPEDGGNTRLIERVRLDIDLKDAQRRGLPMAGLGLFALLRSQMEGIKRRAEGPAGRLNQKRVRPGVDSAPTWPPQPSTSCLTMARPMPAPPSARSRDFSTR